MLKSLTLPLMFLAHSAVAQPIALSGSIDAGASSLADDALFGAVDADLTLQPEWSRAFSFEIGTYLFALEGKKPHETYAAIVWKDDLRIGALRPAYDQVLPSVFTHAAPFLAYARAETTRSHNTIEAMRRTAVPWGLSYQGQSGALEWMVSGHHADKGGFNSASTSFTYQLSEGTTALRLLGGMESVWSENGIHHGTNAKLGLAFDRQDGLRGSLAWLHPEGNEKRDYLAVDLAMDLDAHWSISTMGEFSQHAKDDAYGLAISRKTYRDDRVTLAATDGTVGSAVHLTYTHGF